MADQNEQTPVEAPGAITPYETEATRASAAAGRAKLIEMTGGEKSKLYTPPTLKPSTPPPGAVEKPAPPSTYQEVIERLRNPANPDGIFSKDEKRQKDAMAALRQAMAADEEANEPQLREGLTLQDKRGEFGMQAPELHSAAAREAWDTGREEQAYDIFHGWGFDPPLVQEIVRDYTVAGEGAGMQRIPDNVLDSMQEKYVKSGKVSAEQAAALRKWYASWFPS
jgi:hypothetical protein